LLAEVLNLQAQLAVVHIRKYENNHSTQDARKFVTTLFSDTKKWSTNPGWSGSGMTRLAMELSDLPGHPARQCARRHKEDVQTWIAAMLAKVGVRSVRQRAREIQLVLEGASVLALITGDRGYYDIAGKAARRLLSRNTR
jgi:hypothetical protein